MVRTHSKSRYMDGLQCPKLFWVSMMENERIPPVDAATQYTMDQGNKVGEFARRRMGDGTLVPSAPLALSIQKTQEAMDGGQKLIFEAAFEHRGVHVKVDVLKLSDDGYDIIEVKQSTKLKPEYIPDMAIQRYVMEGAGVQAGRSMLMHLNREYIHPGGEEYPAELFTTEECTEMVLEEMQNVPRNLEQQFAILESGEPDIPIGPQCSKPHACPLWDFCWKDVPRPSVLNIPRLKSRFDLYHAGVRFEDIPDGVKLTPTMERFVQVVLDNKPMVEEEALRNEIEKLEYPLYFMDFETVNWAIPIYNGTRPFQQIPFQWSLHKMNGSLEHKEFLWTEKSDPRQEFTKTLLDALGEEGSIIVYWESFEKGRLKEMLDMDPSLKPRMENVMGRIWDLHSIFKNHYTHPKALGKTSIKLVLPALCPECSYSGLEVQNGQMASATYARMIWEADADVKERMKKSLLEYCKMDTLAMVRLYEKIKEV